MPPLPTSLSFFPSPPTSPSYLGPHVQDVSPVVPWEVLDDHSQMGVVEGLVQGQGGGPGGRVEGDGEDGGLVGVGGVEGGRGEGDDVTGDPVDQA